MRLQELMMNIESLIENIVKKHEALANPIRVHILSIIISLEKASWSEIKEILESIYGKVNPNTLAFHIKKLVDCGFISKEGSLESPIYTAKIPDNLRRELEEIVSFYKKLIGDKR